MHTPKVENPKHCPFCGSRDLGVETSPPLMWVECFTCRALGSSGFDQPEAIAAWNRRAEPDVGEDKQKFPDVNVINGIRFLQDGDNALRTEGAPVRVKRNGAYNYQVFLNGSKYEAGTFSRLEDALGCAAAYASDAIRFYEIWLAAARPPNGGK